VSRQERCALPASDIGESTMPRSDGSLPMEPK
jgi:hypothetical protein